MNGWNVWRIQNRWFRALVTWLIGPPLVVVIGVIVLTCAIIEGVMTAASELGREITRRTWPDIVRPMWQAMLAKGAA